MSTGQQHGGQQAQQQLAQQQQLPLQAIPGQQIPGQPAAAGPGGTANAANIHAALIQNMPQLLKLAKEGHLNETQLAQLRNLAQLYSQQGPNMAAVAMQQQQQMAPSVASGSRPAGAPSAAAPAPNVAGPQPTNTQPPASTPTPAPGTPTAAGQKRKSPMPDTTMGTPQQTSSGSGTPSVGSAAMTGTQAPTVTNPGPQPWPNSVGPRPTLSQGLAAGSSIMGLPTHVARLTDTGDALAALNEGFKKDATSTANELTMRRTIKDLVASIDPNVKIDQDVEDILLEMADEFIDSVTNFACRLAKHRGSDVLDVKDLQLHLERNHNIRIPGFSSDETRLAISHANPATGGHAAKAQKVDTKATKEGGDKEKGGKEGKKNKSKAKETQASGAALRSARLAAVRGAK